MMLADVIDIDHIRTAQDLEFFAGNFLWAGDYKTVYGEGVSPSLMANSFMSRAFSSAVIDIGVSLKS